MNQQPAVELPTGYEYRKSRSEWVDEYRRIVEFFETHTDYDDFESGGRYPDEATPYVLHAKTREPAHADDTKERSWHILWNPWTGREREAWKMDGRPLTPDETAHGDGELTATDKDIVRLPPGRVVVCIALTKVAGIHSGELNWLTTNEQIRGYLGTVLDTLDGEDITPFDLP